MSEQNPFEGGGAPAISFAERDEYGNLKSKPVGTKYTGTIVETPKVVQSRDYDTGKPATWPDGNPKWSVVIGLEINGEKHSLWAPKPSSMFKAIQDALTVNGKVQAAALGGTLSIELSGFQKTEGGKAPQKLYKASYSAPNAFESEAAAPAAAPAEDTSAADAARAAKIASMTPEERKLLGLED